MGMFDEEGGTVPNQSVEVSLKLGDVGNTKFSRRLEVRTFSSGWMGSFWGGVSSSIVVEPINPEIPGDSGRVKGRTASSLSIVAPGGGLRLE